MRPIGDLDMLFTETDMRHRRSTCAFGDRHAPLETDMPHWRRNVPLDTDMPIGHRHVPSKTDMPEETHRRPIGLQKHLF